MSFDQTFRFTKAVLYQLGPIPMYEPFQDATQPVPVTTVDGTSFLKLYDEDGNYLSTAIGHLPIIPGARGLTVTQKDIRSEDYLYYGLLKDVANRTIRTEVVHNPALKSN